MKKNTQWLGLILTFVVCMALLTPRSALALPVSPPKYSMVCLNGPNFDLTATTGYIQTPDGNIVFMWSYADGSGVFQYPGPVLCVNQGELVTINLTNSLDEPTSIVFPGQDTEVSASGGSPGLLAQEAAANGGTVSYSFTAGEPGTYIYESGSDISKQVEMGLYGALIVRPNAVPAGGIDLNPAHYAYASSSTVFDSTREYMILLAEVDPDLHHAVETGGLYDFTALHNRYFTVNGRSFPDTLQENGSNLLPSQPYGALVRLQPTNGVGSTLPALIRMLNLGADNHPFHPHGNHLVEIAQDGRQLLSPMGDVASSERFGETIGSGQTQDYLIRWDDQDLWNPTLNPLPVAQPNYQNLTFKDGVTFYSGNPYLGYKGTLPTGTTSLNVCGEWYFPWHSHALNEFTNYDEGFGGMATLLRVDPSGGCFTFPSSTTILAGTLNSGSYVDLSALDANYYRVNSTTTGTRTTDWYGQFSGVPTGAANLKVTYIGNNTLSASTPYTQNFNSLAQNGTSSSVPAGWAFSETGTGANTTYGTNNGGSSTANTYSYRSNGGGTTDRAFGMLRGSGTNTFASTIGASFTNTTGGTITSLVVSYTGEQWRKGAPGSVAADRLDFQYSTNATSLTTGTWTDVDSLDFNSPVTTGGAGALDGNNAANRTLVSNTISGLNIPNGATYWLRWTDFDRGGSGVADDGLAIDDFSLTPQAGSGLPTNLYIWNWVSAAWEQIAGPTAIGSADATIGPVSVASYIGSGSNKGLVRIRVETTGGGTNFITGGNFMTLVYDAP